jgi:hypothetical protein
MRRVLIVSPHFPPVNAPDMQRLRMSLPFFTGAGWAATVLTVADPTPVAPVEEELLATVPPEVTVVRARCLSRRWTGRFGVGNVALRALPFLFLAGCRLLSRQRYDAVYFSTTMFVVLPLGRIWRWWYGVPYVIDLQDPWVTDYYERTGSPRPPGGWKYRLVAAVSRRLEGWTMRRVSHLITVSAAYGEALRARHPGFRGVPCTELPFGSPDADLAHLRATLARRQPLLPRGGLRVAFAGALGPGMLGTADAFFAGMARARAAGLPISAHFHGTRYGPAGGQPVVLELAARHGLADCVTEDPDRLPYFAALQVTLEADINLILGSTDLAFTPSKILAVLAAGRPVLALGHAGSAMAARLQELGQPCVLVASGPPTAADAAAIHAVLAAPRPPPAPPPARTARAIAERQLEIFAAVAGGEP